MYKLSIVEKAKRYDEALKVAREYWDSPKTCIDINVLPELFSELKESEDERIRKALIKLVKKVGEGYENVIDGVSIENAISWLEKQGEHANFRNKIQIGDKVTRNEDGILVNLSQLNRVAKKDEKQGEQKTADKVEPKFKVGDIVKHKDNPYLTYILKRFTDDGDYEFHAIGKDGNEGCTCFSVVKYQDEWELVEQKPAEWSEIEPIIQHLDNLGNTAMADILRSFEPQPQWKPSEEMLEALYRAIPENVVEISEDEILLDKLYQGLKYGRVLSNK